MSEFYAGFCYGAGFGVLVVLAGLYLADLVWPCLSIPNKDQ